MSKRRLEIFDTLRVDSYLLHQSVFLSVRKLEQKSIHKTSNHFQKKSHTSQREQWSIPIDYWSHISYGSLCVSEPDIQLTKFFTYMWKETPNMEKKKSSSQKEDMNEFELLQNEMNLCYSREKNKTRRNGHK